MSTPIKNENVAPKENQELTNWQKIDQMEAEIEKSKQKKKRRGGMKFKRIFGDTVGQIVLTVLSIIWIIPLFYLLVQSFRKEPGAWSPTFFPQEWTLDNYKRLFTETKFWQWYGNTLLIAVCSCIITAVFVLSVAYVFSRMKFKARKPMMNIMLILGMFPGFMSMSAVYFLLKILLPDNYQSHLSLVIVYSAGAALSYYIAKGFFDTVPKSLDEAARIDGAGSFKIFWSIVMPQVKSAWLTLMIESFKGLWNSGSSIYIYSEQLKSFNYAINQILSAGIVRAGASTAAMVIMMIVPILVFVISQSNIIETMGTSGMKD